MSLIEEKTLADHDINVRAIRQELQLLEEQLKKHGRNKIQPSLTPNTQKALDDNSQHAQGVESVGDDTIRRKQAIDAIADRCDVAKWGRNPKTEELVWTLEKLPSAQPKRETAKFIRWMECKKLPTIFHIRRIANVLSVELSS